MAKQNGIDILCDAARGAGSDMLLSSIFSLAGAAESGPRGVKRVAVDGSPSSLSSSTTSKNVAVASHVCHQCRRVYERADHLTRHIRSHENARQYQCSRCPKRFNRADLLTRHESTHDREIEGGGRTIIRRNDRTSAACANCATSKSKCDDQKPCSRCRSKGLTCAPSQKNSHQFRTSTSASAEDPSHRLADHFEGNANAIVNPATFSSTSVVNSGPMMMATDQMDTASYGMPMSIPMPSNGYAMTVRPAMSSLAAHPSAPTRQGVHGPGLSDVLSAAVPHPMMHVIPDDLIYFNPMHNFSQQDMDFTAWDLDFDTFAIPRFESHGPSPQSTRTGSSQTANRTYQDSTRRHAAFKRSPWLWDPEPTDYVRRDTEGLHLNEDVLSHPPALDGFLERPINKLRMSKATRDRLFSIVVAENKDPARVPSFPSLELLNYLMQAHFVHDEYQCDSWVHAASFNPETCLPELLACAIANGASFIANSSVWQFGLGMQEVVRQRLSTVFESCNSNTRRLECLQAYMLQLDIGIWSGFKRKTELAESFLQPLMTMLRRAGVFMAPADSPDIVPLASDSTEVLEMKWQKFVARESYKRLVLHLFCHDVQSSVSLQKNPLMSFTELAFSLPAARDLWMAPSAQAWREAYLAKRPLLPNQPPLARVSEVMHCLNILDDVIEYVDADLCYMAVENGFWGQIAAYREGVKFYQHGGLSKQNSTHRLWLKSQHQELYRDLGEFSSAVINTARKPAINLAIAAQLFMMVLHVSLDDLQRFAGKAGEEEAGRASLALEEGWARTPDSRYAVWHAGQVLRNARLLPPTSLKGFNAMAVYFATLALWVYGILGCGNGDGDAGDGAHRDLPTVVLDSEESREVQAFLQLSRGTPGLMHGRFAEPLSDPGLVLANARDLYRDNFPVRSEPLPPLVESLGTLLRDLGSANSGRVSSGGSESESGSLREG
ncbi:hypothetical protein B0T22DRAFT_450768 [Podospora appendiculata]|uniref:Uncharacterized protein n=1 Tax=Podospora appendiculata TaxID=314037 RepID=A0AAE0XI89_9PEZI|nr:hypothetical protein B0T22DRAFT_450768 [Podospora appendiculata]